MRIFLITTILLIAKACKKEPALQIDATFEGDWIHFETASQFKELHIYEDNKGYIWYSGLAL